MVDGVQHVATGVSGTS